MLDDQHLMRLALDQARLAYGRTSPNPMVGAILSRDGIVLGRGFHARAGLAHAEVAAIADARAAGHDIRAATLHVTLEPCCTSGRTPPCTDAILQAGISRVVYGCTDPNPAHAGRGLELLRSHGIEVCGPVLEAACLHLNRAFFHWINHRRPWLILKLAQSADGRIATAAGESRWITGPASRERVQQLRRYADAIIVGGETARLDDPSLLVADADWPCQARRHVWTRCPESLPPELKIFRPDGAWGGCTQADSAEQWDAFLAELGTAGCTCLLAEGGGGLSAALLHAGVLDELQIFIAPKIIGGLQARPSFAGPELLKLDQAQALQLLEVERLDDDLLLTYRPLKRTTPGA